MQMKQSPCTLQDIANEVGCVTNTVSLALRGSTRISEKMRTRIQQTATRMGYIPNLAARNLKTRQSGLIGIYAAGAEDDVRVTLINSLIKQLHTTHYKPVLGIADFPGESWATAPWLQSFRALNVDALVVIAWELQKDVATIARQVPTIVVGCPPVTREKSVDYVALDRFEAGQIGTEHLLRNGNRKICICAAPPTDDFSKGCLETLRKAGVMPCGPKIKKYPSVNEMDGFCADVIASRPKPTAVIFGDSAKAAVFLTAALRQGVRIPQDLAVIGYDFFAWADHLKVALTTIEQPLSKMAPLAVDLIKKRLEEPQGPRIHHTLPHHLAIRESS